MAILEIARMGASTLREPARPVDDPTAPEIRALVEDMFETMIEAGGVGLAAPQVRVPLRLVIFQLPGGRVAAQDGGDEAPGGPEGAGEEGEEAEVDPRDLPLHVFINPVIEPLDDEQALGWEGCLSLPGLRGLVPRYMRIRYSAFNLAGELVEGEAEGFHARVIQHECDHLDGFVYPMRMADLSLLGYDSEWARALREEMGREEMGREESLAGGDESGTRG
jgi:peptide deformylase